MIKNHFSKHGFTYLIRLFLLGPIWIMSFGLLKSAGTGRIEWFYSVCSFAGYFIGTAIYENDFKYNLNSWETWLIGVLFVIGAPVLLFFVHGNVLLGFIAGSLYVTGVVLYKVVMGKLGKKRLGDIE